ncbi:MAG: glycine--tRNA ligase [Candidatus Thorarchaeota archaeon]|nr:glycine--tRNA ligase [Candidatus Thorarchaeota archaeon]
MPSEQDFSETIYGLCKKRGFFWGPSPEIYGGSAGLYDLGPLGKLLKNRLENVIRASFVKAGFWEVECPTVSPAVVWKASGHEDGFVDPVTECTKCGQAYRADNLIEEQAPTANIRGLSIDELTAKIRELDIRCPSCKSELGAVRRYNLMLRTKLGLGQDAYMRPETATTTYLLFKRLLTFFRDRLPAMVFQIGKAYRNEISPRQGMLRLREFTQVEGQIFLQDPDEVQWPKFESIENEQLPLLPYTTQEKKSDKVDSIKMKDALKKGHFQTPAYAWCVHLAYSIFRSMGFSPEHLRLRQHLPSERAHYAADAWDIEVLTRSFGWVECCGVHDRGNYDLGRHQEFSKEKMTTKVDGKDTVPNVLEIAFGVERPMFCQIDNAYDEDPERTWLRFPPPIAPVQVAVFPLMDKEELTGPASRIHGDVSESGLISYYDTSGSIGRRYRRQDEIGTPYCVTVDYQTIDDATVTVRDRDSMEQVRIRTDDLLSTLRRLVSGRVSFESLKSQG